MEGFSVGAARPNPSLKPSPKGGSRRPGRRYTSGALSSNGKISSSKTPASGSERRRPRSGRTTKKTCLQALEYLVA
jgi:hypothetical protein